MQFPFDFINCSAFNSLVVILRYAILFSNFLKMKKNGATLRSFPFLVAEVILLVPDI